MAPKELSKKTTILLSPELHDRLTRIAQERHVSLGHLVRTACEKQYGIASARERIEAVRRLGELALPVGEPGKMKRESVPSPEDLMG